MGITYNRTMKITYALANSIGDKQVIGAFLSNLHDKGVSAMNYSWENEPSDKNRRADHYSNSGSDIYTKLSRLNA
mgnify:CR=1 FL=1